MRPPRPTIKSTKTSLLFSNTEKQEKLALFISEYKSVVSQFVDILWEMDEIKSLLPKEVTDQVSTWLSARMIQCAGKQASGIARGTKRKQEKRLFIINKLTNEGKFKQARKLQRIYDEVTLSKPRIDNINPELDSRFIKIDLDNSTSFDGWLTITSIGAGVKLILPFKKNKHFNEMFSNGAIKAGIRVNTKYVTFMFDIPAVNSRVEGSTLGIDIGQTTVLSCSDGVSSQRNNHGYDLSSITDILCRKKKGSKAFERCSAHRFNYINWSINQINFSGIKQVNLERLFKVGTGNKRSRKLSHWNYSDIVSKVEDCCKELGVLIHKVNPTYTSQRCSSCGWVRKRNRKGKVFKCSSCGFEHDADLNAAINISLPLLGITKQQRLRRANMAGFYWLVEGQESIVPVTQRA